jgi:membrane protease YdiL (CAAX protease family)
VGWSEDEQRAPPDGDLSPEGINPEPPVPAPGVPGPPPLVPPGSSPLGVRLQALFEVVVCSDFPTQLFVGQVLVLAGIRPFTADHRYSATFILTLSLADAVLLVGLVLWFLLIHGERPLEVLFGRRAVWREALVGVLLTPVVFLIAILVLATVQQFLPSLHNVAHNPLETLVRTRTTAVLFGVVAVVGGGIREEVQRAFILHRFDQHLGGAPLGLFAFSLVFGAGHIIQGWDVALTTAALGAFWGATYLVRRSIVAPMVSHAGFDLAEIIRYTLYGP